MVDVMSFNSGHFGWCDREKFRKRCNDLKETLKYGQRDLKVIK